MALLCNMTIMLILIVYTFIFSLEILPCICSVDYKPGCRRLMLNKIICSCIVFYIAAIFVGKSLCNFSKY